MYGDYNPFAKENQETSDKRQIERKAKVSKFLDDKDSEEVYRDVALLLNNFVSKCPDYTARLAGQIGSLVENGMKAKDITIRDKEKGIESIEWIIRDKSTWNAKDYVCFGHEFMRAYFPKATPEHCLDSMRIYFDEYVEALKECQDKIIDGDWAVDIVKMNEYFKKLLEYKDGQI